MNTPDIIIYHSRDLDGLSSGAVLLSVYGEVNPNMKVIGYHYKELFDTRFTKSKNVVIVDVSLDMQKMFSMSRMAKNMTWIDHHKSQYDELLQYCENNNYEVKEMKFNDLITMIEVRKEDGTLCFTKFYSERLSAAEVTIRLYGDKLGDIYHDAVAMLGQYDTWRNVPERQLLKDKHWEKQILPFQYGMRLHETVFDVQKKLELLADWQSGHFTDAVITEGMAIIKYQETINKKNMRFTKEIELRTDNAVYTGIAFNGGPFNSQTFKSKFNPDVHDFMMPYQFQGAAWNFSLYTTKDDVDILSIAKQFGGGGHKQACGFQLEPNKVVFDEEGNLIMLAEV